MASSEGNTSVETASAPLRRTATEVLASAFTIYLFACVFYNSGFFLGIGEGFDFARAFLHIDDFLSAPIVPAAGMAIVIFGNVGFVGILFATASLALVVRWMLDFWVGNHRLPQPTDKRRRLLLTKAGGVLDVLAVPYAIVFVLWAFGSWLLVFQFHVPSYGTADLVTVARFIFALGLILGWFALGRDVNFYWASLVTVAAHFAMLLFFASGFSIGAGLKVDAADQVLTLVDDVRVSGSAAMKVPSGLIFVEHREPRNRVAVYYSDEQIVRVDPIPRSEKPRSQRPPGKKIFCEFVDFGPTVPDVCPWLGIPKTAAPGKPSPSLSAVPPQSSAK